MIKKVKILTAIAVLSLLTACGGGGDSAPPFLSSNYGTWNGSLQQDARSTLSATLTLGPAGYDIDYRPLSNCYGQLILVSENSVEAVFTERITFGLQNCITGGRVVLSKAASNAIDFKWYDPLTNALRVVGFVVKK
jgi:hypothetical protein